MVGDADPPPAPASAGTFRDRLRNCFSAALHGLAADGVVAIDAAEIPVLLEQVRETADAKFVSVGAVEARFYVELMTALGLSADDAQQRFERSTWAQRKEQVAAAFRTRTRAEWCEVLEGTDACFAPVLGLAEAPHHPHNVSRGTFVDIGGILQPAPAPRFSRTPPAVPSEPCAPDRSVSAILEDWGRQRRP